MSNPPANAGDGGTQHQAESLRDAANAMSAEGLDALIRQLADLRSRLLPSHPAVPPPNNKALYQGDNMLWHVRAARNAPAMELSIYNAGLGWISILLSRAQIEDMMLTMTLVTRDLPATQS
jgi:hypothetical protein